MTVDKSFKWKIARKWRLLCEKVGCWKSFKWKKRKGGCSKSFEWKKRSLDVLGKISSMKEEPWPIKDVDKDEYLDWNEDDVDYVES